MTETTESLRKDLKTLRDQLRVKLHLARMDVKDAYQKLEKEADQIEHEATRATKQALTDLVDKFRELGKKITS